MNIQLSDVATKIKNNDFFLILIHMYPDGDALGSSFGICRALQKIGKHARILCSDPVPQKFLYLTEFIIKEDFEPRYIISVDLPSVSLLGADLQKYSNLINICIDHHPSNTGYAHETFVDADAAANCEIIYKILLEMNIKIDTEIASCLYTGISTDTGCFEYSNTSASSHRIAADLMDLGADSAKINERLFMQKSRKKLETEKIMYKNLEYSFGEKCAVTSITTQEMQSASISDNELDGIASIPIKIEGVQIGITLREKPGGLFKASVRTRENIDANKFCSIFGGGGHAKSGGFNIEGNLKTVKLKISDAIASMLGWQK